MGEIIELLADLWIALSEPLRTLVGHPKRFENRIHSAIKISGHDKDSFYESFESILSMYNLSEVKYFLMTPSNVKGRKCKITAVSSMMKYLWSVTVVVPENRLEWIKDEYCISYDGNNQ